MAICGVYPNSRDSSTFGIRYNIINFKRKYLFIILTMEKVKLKGFDASFMLILLCKTGIITKLEKWNRLHVILPKQISAVKTNLTSSHRIKRHEANKTLHLMWDMYIWARPMNLLTSEPRINLALHGEKMFLLSIIGWGILALSL